jgi:hypothetical protein
MGAQDEYAFSFGFFAGLLDNARREWRLFF